MHAFYFFQCGILRHRGAAVFARALGVGALLFFTALGVQAKPLEVVASFSLLADLVKQVGGERVLVSALAGPDTDAHHFQARPSDARRLGQADIIVMNGLGFDDWMSRLARSSGFSGVLLTVSDGLPYRLKDESGHAHGHSQGHRHAHGSAGQGYDPHAWQDVANVRVYVQAIAQALSTRDPEGRAAYEARARFFLAELDRLDTDIRTALNQLPEERRTVLIQHNAFAYFGQAYGLRILAITGTANHAEASASHLARLVRLIQKEGVAALFLENVRDDRLIQSLQRETGVRIGGRLYSDALSAPQGPAPTYVCLMRHNLSVFVRALAPAEDAPVKAQTPC